MQRSIQLVLALLMATIVSAIPVVADEGLEIDWSRADIGVNVMYGGSFNLTGMVGRPDAGAEMVGGGFALTGGVYGVTIVSQPSSTPIPGVTIIGLWALAAILLIGARLYGGGYTTVRRATSND